MHLKAFTTSNCFYCTQLKELFTRIEPNGEEVLEITTIHVGRDISKEYFKHQYPDAVGFPYVILDDEHLGGLIETAKFLLQKRFVVAKKK